MKRLFVCYLLLFVCCITLGLSHAEAAPGDLIRTWGNEYQIQDLAGIAVDSDGKVYLSEVTGRVKVFDSAGQYLHTIGEYGVGDGQFSGSYFLPIALDSIGQLYTLDGFLSRVQVFDNSGNFIRKWGGKGGAMVS